jgi:hypothetical protein
MDATCGTCKHWKRVDAESTDIEDPRYGQCEAIPRAEYEWDEDLDIHVVKGDWQAVAVDGSGYFAALRTRESFGCILHDPSLA